MHPSRRALPMLLSLLLAPLGCGAVVTFEDGDGAPGSGEDGEDGDGEGATPLSECSKICEGYQEAGCSQPGCVAACTGAYAEPDCQTELVALTGCMLSTAPDEACAFPPACTSAYVDYLTCSGEERSSHPGGCTRVIEGSLVGGASTSFSACDDVVLTSTCFGSEQAGIVCECSANGVVAGTCEEYFSGSDVFGDCCEFIVPWPSDD